MFLLNRSKKRMHRVVSKALSNPTMRFPLGVFGSLDDFPFRKMIINIYHMKTPVKSTTFFVPKQQQWTFRTLEEVLKDREQPGFVYKDTKDTEGSADSAWNQRKTIKSTKFGKKPNYVRIRVLQHQKTAPNGTVLFHCHGGKIIIISFIKK